MSIDPSLILNIALGIIVAKALIVVWKETVQIFKTVLERTVPRRKAVPVDDHQDTEDWLELWESVPESAKQQSQRFIEDDQLRQRAQEMNLWPFLWAAAPEEAKEKLRARWNLAKTQPPKSRT